MSDYLIEAATKEEWAERALRAEAKLRDMALDCLAAEGQAADAYQAQLAAEDKLDKAVEALGGVLGACDEGRIEELDKACKEWAEVSQRNYQRAKAAEAKLSKSEDLLAKVVAFLDDLWDSGDYFAGELNDLRRELKGETDA
jgi:hypothetical protein